MSLDLVSDIKLCQSCIERGFNPPQPATREWQEGLFYCEDCFNALLNNLTNIPQAEIANLVEEIKDEPTKIDKPMLEMIYQAVGVPVELQFDKVDTVCRNYEKIFNFHAPAIINRDLKSLENEVEQLGMALFHIKYRIDPLEGRIKALKEEARKEANLKSYDDSKEIYSKPKKAASSQVRVSQEEKLAKSLGMSLEEYRVMQEQAQAKMKKERERKFNILAGNCPECGGAMPCLKGH